MVEWDANIHISDSAPAEYFPKYLDRFKKDPEKLSQMMMQHALPPQWESMPYDEFLRERRKLMAKVIRKSYERLANAEMDSIPREIPLSDLIAQGESAEVEFKSTLRLNLHTGQKDEAIEHAALKTIVAFLNTHGGHLLIGVKDSGEALGINADGFAGTDKMLLHLDNLITSRIGSHQMLCIRSRFETYDQQQILIIKCIPGKAPAYLSRGNTKHFFIRAGASTKELGIDEIHTYIEKRFH